MLIFLPLPADLQGRRIQFRVGTEQTVIKRKKKLSSINIHYLHTPQDSDSKSFGFPHSCLGCL